MAGHDRGAGPRREAGGRSDGRMRGLRAGAMVLGAAFLVFAAVACSGSAAAPSWDGSTGGNGAVAPAAAPSAAGAGTDAGSQSGKSGSNTSGNEQAVYAPAQNLIIKTGQVTLQVIDVDKAVTQAQATITGFGGYVAQTTRSGSGDTATASITYRIPSARWDDALAALHKLATKVVDERTGTDDVTSQVVDLEARLSNLQATERALQGIMAKASAIPDILSVEQQLSNTQGQIEQLTAQRDHLKDQAAMSTLTALYQLPSGPVATATRDWDLGAQIADATAALVRIGQGLLTLVVWAAIVLLPLGIGVLLAIAVLLFVVRRLFPDRGRGVPAPPA